MRIKPTGTPAINRRFRLLDRRAIRISLVLRYGSYIGLTETRIKIAQYLFRRRGIVVVLVARFVAVLRSVVGFIAGANRMPFARFMIANSAGAMAWALFYGLGAYYLGIGIEQFARPVAISLAVVGGAIVIAVILYLGRKEQETRCCGRARDPRAGAGGKKHYLVLEFASGLAENTVHGSLPATHSRLSQSEDFGLGNCHLIHRYLLMRS
jgi:hypothetical protein